MQLSLINLNMVYLVKKVIKHKMKRIQSKKHTIGIYEINKLPLSCFDDEIYMLDDGIRTFAYFHKDSATSFNKIKKDCDKKRLQ